jgi:hypothetical protein
MKPINILNNAFVFPFNLEYHIISFFYKDEIDEFLVSTLEKAYIGYKKTQLFLYKIK